jgi:hypothetical protein
MEEIQAFAQELFEHFKPLITIISDGSYTDTSVTGNYCNVTNGFRSTTGKVEMKKGNAVHF